MLTSIGACLVSARRVRSSSRKERGLRSRNASPRKGTAELRGLRHELRDRWIPTRDRESRTLREPSTLGDAERSEEHTSELQSRENIVCRLLLEKKKQTKLVSTLPVENIRIKCTAWQ